MSDTGRSSKSSLALLVVAVALFGLAYGADSTAAGNGILRPTLTSLLVQGGASQIAAEGVLRSHGSSLAAIVVGMALNLRFMALALVVADDLPSGRIRRWLSIYLISDIPVGLALQGTTHRSRARIFVEVGIVAAAAWVIGTFVGTLAGSAFDVSDLGADGAIAAAFVALALGQITSRRTVILALVSFAVTVVLMQWLEGGIAVLGGSAAGLLLDAALGREDPVAASPEAEAEVVS